MDGGTLVLVVVVVVVVIVEVIKNGPRMLAKDTLQSTICGHADPGGHPIYHSGVPLDGSEKPLDGSEKTKRHQRTRANRLRTRI